MTNDYTRVACRLVATTLRDFIYSTCCSVPSRPATIASYQQHANKHILPRLDARNGDAQPAGNIFGVIKPKMGDIR